MDISIGTSVGCLILLALHFIQVANHFIGRHYVPQVNVDIQQIHLMHDLAAFADGFAGDDDVVMVGGIAAGGVDAVTGAYAGDNEGVDFQGGEGGVQVGGVECAGVFFANELFIVTTAEARVDFHVLHVVGRDFLLALLGMRRGWFGRVVIVGSKKNRDTGFASGLEDFCCGIDDGIDVAAHGKAIGVGPPDGQINHHNRRPVAPAAFAGPVEVLVMRLEVG